MSLKSLFLCLAGLLVFTQHSWSQVYTDTLTEKEAEVFRKRMDRQLKRTNKKVRFQVLPSVYYTPETRLAFGAVGIVSFKFDSQDSVLMLSKITPSFIYTQNKQMLSNINYDLHVNRKWWVYGDLGYFDYPYFFSGVGNNHEGDFYEWYDATYPKLSLNIYRKVISDSISVGLKYAFQESDITPEPNGILENGFYSGNHGSTQSSLGLGLRYDSRSHIWSSVSGWYTDFSFMVSDSEIGASFSDQFATLDIRKYFSISPKQDVFALQFYSELHTGSVPFNLMALLGGSEQMRGYRKGVFRDRAMLVYQAEYRSRLLFKYFALAGFASIGGIGDNLTDANKNYRYTAGAGIRYTPLPKERLFLRFDYAWGENTEGFYISVGEAF